MKIIVIILDNEILSVHEFEGVTSINSSESKIIVCDVADAMTMLTALGIEDLSQVEAYISNRPVE